LNDKDDQAPAGVEILIQFLTHNIVILTKSCKGRRYYFITNLEKS